MRHLIALSLLVSGTALADPSGTIEGMVTDGDTGGPIARAWVRLRSPELLGRRQTSTDVDGYFIGLQLPPGVYSIEIEADGFEYRRVEGVTVEPGGSTRQMLTVVRATPPDAGGHDVHSVELGAAMTGLSFSGFADRLPFVLPNEAGLRSAESLLAAAPQTVADPYGFGVSGNQSLQRTSLVDGVRTNDPLFGFDSAAVPLEFLQSARLVTSGLPVSTGRTAGAALLLSTKTGSNQLRGQVWSSWTPGALSATPRAPSSPTSSLGISRQPWNVLDVGLDVGGPLINDRLWFYVGLTPTAVRTRVTRTARAFELDEAGTSFERLDDGTLATTTLGDAASSRFEDARAWAAIGKLTLALTDGHQLSLTTLHRNQTIEQPGLWSGGLGDLRESLNATTTSLSYSGVFGRHLVVEAGAGWHHLERSRLPTDGSTLGSTTEAASTPQVQLRSGYTLADLQQLSDASGALCEPSGTKPTSTVVVDGTPRALARCPVSSETSALTLGGPGLLSTSVMNRLEARAAGTVHFRLLGHHAITVGADLEVLRAHVRQAMSGGSRLSEDASGTFVTEERLSGVASSTPSSFSTAVFAQERWNIVDALTLSLGLRYENQHLYDSSGDIAVAVKNVLSPRAAIIYDFSRQGRSRLYAGYARYAESLPLAAAMAVEGEPRQTFTRRSGCDLLNDVSGCLADERISPAPGASGTQLDPAVRSTGGVRLGVDPALQPQTTDELAAGIEYELTPGLVAGFGYTRRFVNGVIEDISLDDGQSFFLGTPGQGWASSMPKASRDYDALTVSVSRTLSRGLLVQASYTWSSLRGNFEGPSDANSGLAPHHTPAFNAASAMTNRGGALDGDRTHTLRALAAKEFELNKRLSILVGLAYLGQSGRPIDYLASHPTLGEAQSFVLPRGTAGRTGFMHSVNLKVGATYRFTSSNALTLSVDVFNLFNLQEAASVDENVSHRQVLPVASDALGRWPQDGSCLTTAGPQCQSVLTTLDSSGARRTTSADLSTDFKRPTAYQQPLTTRLSLRLTF